MIESLTDYLYNTPDKKGINYDIRRNKKSLFRLF
jgi:hypothetical protein